MSLPVRAKPFVTPMPRGRLPQGPCRHVRVDDRKRQSGRRAPPPSGVTPSTIMSPPGSQPGPRTEIRLGARAHFTRNTHYAHGPPPLCVFNPVDPDRVLDTGFLHR
jgi:hypothetical protein